MKDTENKKFRHKLKEWADNHPQTVAVGGYIFAMTSVVTLSMFQQNSQRIQINKQIIKDHELTLKNNTLLAERQDKANDFAASAAVSGHVVHTLRDGNLLSVPSDAAQKIHFV